MNTALMKSIGLALFLSVGVFGCSTRLVAGQDSKTLLPSDLVADPEKYDGTHVDVRGYIVIGPETRNIFDSEVGFRDPHGACLGVDRPGAMFESFHKRFTRKISGIFRKSLCGPRDVCLFWCSSSGIELDKGSKP